jgi:hypothetical protein
MSFAIIPASHRVAFSSVAGRIVLSFKPPGFFDKYGEEAVNNMSTVEGENGKEGGIGIGWVRVSGDR